MLTVTRWSRLDQRSYSTLGPATAWMGDRLWTGKLSDDTIKLINYYLTLLISY